MLPKSQITPKLKPEVKFLSLVKGCTTLGCISNDIWKDLNIYSGHSKINDYHNKWYNHVKTMEEDCHPRLELEYRPSRSQIIGCTRKG